MSPIDRTRRALELLRNQASGPGGSAKARGMAATSHAGASSQPAPLARQLTVQRLRALSELDPDHDRRSIRVFVECVMETEWGPMPVNSPEYQEMLETVIAQITQDPGLFQAVTRMLAELRAAG